MRIERWRAASLERNGRGKPRPFPFRGAGRFSCRTGRKKRKAAGDRGLALGRDRGVPRLHPPSGRRGGEQRYRRYVFAVASAAMPLTASRASPRRQPYVLIGCPASRRLRSPARILSRAPADIPAGGARKGEYSVSGAGWAVSLHEYQESSNSIALREGPRLGRLTRIARNATAAHLPNPSSPPYQCRPAGREKHGRLERFRIPSVEFRVCSATIPTRYQSLGRRLRDSPNPKFAIRNPKSY